jgi:16S rRNA (cytosine967-C5)-methyltransferase
VSEVRARAAWLVSRVLAGQSLSKALPLALKGLPKSQHALLKALGLGTVRWYPRLAFLLRQLLHHPIQDKETYALALVGLHQLAFMAVKPHAAVAETVAAAKPWAKPLINALLRNYQRRQEALEALAEADYEASLSHPSWLRHKIEQAWPKEAQTILSLNNQHPPFTVRVNLARIPRALYAKHLKAQGFKVRELKWVDSALIVEPAVPVEDLPSFAQGWVSVQDASAQLAAPLLAVEPGQRVLDVCAAPGGKTLHLWESCPGLAELVAVEIAEERLERLKENLSRGGAKVTLICADARDPKSWWNGRLFDRILVDAPCTATGVIRRHPDIKLLRRAQDVLAFALLQRQILDAIWPLLAPGGRLVYATCSLLPEENEEQVLAFLKAHADAKEVPIEASWGRRLKCGRQILPREDADGFFYACLEKR